MEYNYKRFIAKEQDSIKPNGLQVGDTVPDFKLLSLDGDGVRLFGNSNKVIVLESGSITCPVYSGNITDMNVLAKEYPDMEFKVLYTREAHPGKKIPKHTNIKEKITLAGKIKNHYPENREVLVDDLVGTAHKYLDLLPDLLLVIGKDRKVLYKLRWNSVITLKEVLENIKMGNSVKNIVPKERKVHMYTMLPVLLRAGYSSMFDFLKSIPYMIQHGKKHSSNKID